MNWFSGTIPEAITKSKESNCLFLVFVYDKSELSINFEKKLNGEIISSVLRPYIAIKLENGSKDAMQFAQIYPLILVPSLFFINPKTGVPLEVIGGEIEVGSLSEKIQRLLQSNEIKSDSEVNHVTSEMNSTASDQPIIKVDEGDPPAAPSGSSSSSSVSLEGRVEKAKEILCLRQQQKAKEELEEEKRKELKRRRQLQELNLAKKKKDDSERDEIKKHRMKEKEEDRLAREKVKAQIAADREERKKRSALLQGEQELLSELGDQPTSASNVAAASSSSSPSLERDNNNNAARIKFRFPDNSSELAFFQASSTLGDVRTHLVEKSGFSSRFKMVGTLPSRTFTEEQMTRTLRELQLTPSSIIIVKPIVSSMSLSPSTSGGNFVVSLFWQLLAPLSLLFDYLSGWFGLRSSSSSPQPASSSNRPSSSGERPKLDSSSNRPNRGDGGSYREGGNVHRLRRPRDGDNDDDDENNTWNGNSTQQM